MQKTAQGPADKVADQARPRLSQGPREQPAELDFLRGLAFARKQQWSESRQAFVAGRLKSPGDPRFLVELAGVDYKQNHLSAAERNLRGALRLGSRDAYTFDFL